MSDWGIKISLPGFDVLTATPEQSAFHSGYDTFKIKRNASPAHFGIVRVTFNNEPANGSTTNILTASHGYSYQPACMAHADATTVFGVNGQIFLDALAETYYLIYTTTTQIKIDFVKGTTSPPTMLNRVDRIRYYVFAEDGS